MLGPTLQKTLLVEQAVELASSLRLWPKLAPPEPVRSYQSNQSVLFPGQCFVKFYSKPFPGTHPEPEMLLLLAKQGFLEAPRCLAFWQRVQGGHHYTTAIAQRFVENTGDAFTWLSGEKENTPKQQAWAALLGRTIARMHGALACTAEPWRAKDIDSLECDFALEQRELGVSVSAPLPCAGNFGMRMRIHGDLHLGQILCTEQGPVVTDFEGEPLRPIRERRRKASPLRDVAGMLRSFSYAGHDELRAPFLQSYLQALRASKDGSGLLPQSPNLEMMLHFFVKQKALYELRYERRHRPKMAWIPAKELGI
jgi:maltokinase